MDHLVLIILNMIVLKNSYESKATIGLHLRRNYRHIAGTRGQAGHEAGERDAQRAHPGSSNRSGG